MVSGNFRWDCGQLLNLNPIDRLGHLAAALDTSSMNPQTTEESLSLVMGVTQPRTRVETLTEGTASGVAIPFLTFLASITCGDRAPVPAMGVEMRLSSN